MSTAIPPEVVAVIRDAVTRHPEGATVMDILAAFPEPPTRRTVQRWLGRLVEDGILELRTSNHRASLFRYILRSGAATAHAGPPSAAVQRPPVASSSPAHVQRTESMSSEPAASHVQRGRAVSSESPSGHVQRPEAVSSGPVQRMSSDVTLLAGHDGVSTQAPDGPSLTPTEHTAGPSMSSEPTPGHVQRRETVSSDPVQRASNGPSPSDPSPSSALRHPPSGSNPPSASTQPKPHLRTPPGRTASDADAGTVPAADGSVEAAVANVATDVLARVLGHRPKSGEPVRKPRPQTLPLLAAGALSAAILSAPRYIPLNGWTLAGFALLAFAAAGYFLWRAHRETLAAADPASPGSTEPPSASPDSAAAYISTFQGRRALCRIAAAAMAAVALVAAFLAYRQFRLRPSIGTVQAFVTSQLASLPVEVFALDADFQAPGGGGVRLTYVAAVVNTTPMYTTAATSVYLQNQPGKLAAALTHTDMLLDGVRGDRLRAIVGPAPTPDPRTVRLLKTAVPIGTPTVTSGTLFAWRTDHGWKFSVESETPPRFAGEPRPTDRPSFVLDDPKDAAALADLLQRHAAYAAQVQAADEAESDKRWR